MFDSRTTPAERNVLATLQQTDNVYRLLVFLHVFAAVVGFGSTFVYPVLGKYAKQHPGPEGKGASDGSLHAGTRLSHPFILATGVLGVILVVVGPWGFDETWVWLSLGIYLASQVFANTVHLPNLRRMNTLVGELTAVGPPPADPSGGPPPQVIELQRRGKAATRNGSIQHLAFAIILLLMIWGPRGAF